MVIDFATIRSVEVTKPVSIADAWAALCGILGWLFVYVVAGMLIAALFKLASLVFAPSVPGTVALGCILAATSVAIASKHLSFAAAAIGPAMMVTAFMGLTALFERGAPAQSISPFVLIVLVIVIYAIPTSVVCAILGVLTVWLRTPPAKAGTCQGCDYDLTGLTADKCPECGAAVIPAGSPTVT